MKLFTVIKTCILTIALLAAPFCSISMAQTKVNLQTQVVGTLAVATGGTGTASTLSGLMRGSASAMTAAEISGDCTTSGSNAITCTKTNGTAFAASATTNTTNASNITTGTLPHAQLPTLLSGDIPNNAANTSGTAATATNVSGGALGSLHYQSGASVTAFLSSPTTSGHTFVPAWLPTGSTTAMTVLDMATYMASPPPIGSSTPSSGSFTTIFSTSGLFMSSTSTVILGATGTGLFAVSGSTLIMGSSSSYWQEFDVNTNGVKRMSVTNNGVQLNVLLPLALYSAAGTALPTCNSAENGATAKVSDATAPLYMTAYTSGGGITAEVICSYNGTSYAWLTH